MTDKIECKTKPKPNCRVQVKEGWDWELRWFDTNTGMVYAYHRGYLWPQRHKAQYNTFQHILYATPDENWQNFNDYQP